MKKLFLLLVLFATVAISSNAQQAPSHAEKIQVLQEQVKPLLIQKLNISDDQAEKLIRIHVSYSGRMEKVSTLEAEKRNKITEELVSAETKEYSAIPLTTAQIKTVRELFAEHKKKQVH